MSKHHPEHLGLVGRSGSLLRLEASLLLDRLIHEVWSRHASLDVSSEAIDSLVEEFGSFVDDTQVRVSYCAPIVNLRIQPSVAEIPILPGVTIKHLSDADVTDLHGGRADVGMLSPTRGPHAISAITEYAFVGEFDEPKRFEGDGVGSSQAYEEMQGRLRQAVLALRSFKSGPVGYRELHMKPIGFSPLPRCTVGHGAEHIPSGRYVLCAEQVDSLRAHARQIAASLHPALSLAISRLSDAEVRISARDKLIDAVIGLDAVLLPEGNRQELRYRFAMNYASLADAPEEKLSRFGAARDIYDSRSTLAHGRHIEDDKLVPVGEHKVTLSRAAETACEMLREVVKHFLPKGHEPDFSDQQYWERELFGLPHPKQ